jgi:FAD:protein FMN transferase
MLLSLLRVAPFVFLLGGQERYEFTEVHMGMPVRVVLYAGTDSAARSAARAAFRRIAELDDTFSDYRPQSEARRLADRADEWVPVSADMFTVLARSIEISRLTAGAFDVTVAPIVALWREARRTGVHPRPGQIDSAEALVGWRRISLDSARRSVRLEPGTRLDFGGIAKGYIIGRALAAAALKSVMIEAGGDIVVSDAPPGTSGWKIDVGGRVESLRNSAVSTSGPTAQFVVIDGQRYSHVVDPRTGLALTNGYLVRVMGNDPSMTDALATAASVDPALAAPLAKKLRLRIEVTSANQ